jgi:serine/threonine-protein kinase
VEAASGHTLFRRSRVVYALPFSLKTLQPTGEPFPVAGNAPEAYDGYLALRFVSVSRDGTLVYIDASPEVPRQLVRRDRNGRKVGTVGQPQARMGHTRLSPDGRRAVVNGRERAEDERSLWIHDVDPPLKNRFTFVPAGRPQWSPTGDRIAYSSRHGRDSTDVFVKPVDGSVEPEVVVATPDGDSIHDWSRDGRYVLFQRGYRTGAGSESRGLWYVDLGGQPGPSEPRRFIDEGTLARFSPDGRYVAYLSDEMGLMEVYVQRFPEGGSRLQVSHGGATQMRWGRNGEIFYVKMVVVRGEGAGPVGTGTLVGVPMNTEPTLTMGVPETLFESPGLAKPSHTPIYDASADGQTFVIPEPVGEQPPRVLRVVQNWAEEFRER